MAKSAFQVITDLRSEVAGLKAQVKDLKKIIKDSQWDEDSADRAKRHAAIKQSD